MVLKTRVVMSGMALGLMVAALLSQAEQKVVFEDWEVHYSVFNSMFLDSAVADEYEITRAANRAVVTVSVLNPQLKAQPVDLSGSYQNQLSQTQPLNFKQIQNGSVYYVATLRFTDREILRFKLHVQLPQGERLVQFSQKFYVDR